MSSSLAFDDRSASHVYVDYELQSPSAKAECMSTRRGACRLPRFCYTISHQDRIGDHETFDAKQRKELQSISCQDRHRAWTSVRTQSEFFNSIQHVRRQPVAAECAKPYSVEVAAQKLVLNRLPRSTHAARTHSCIYVGACSSQQHRSQLLQAVTSMFCLKGLYLRDFSVLAPSFLQIDMVADVSAETSQWFPHPRPVQRRFSSSST